MRIYKDNLTGETVEGITLAEDNVKDFKEMLEQAYPECIVEVLRTQHSDLQLCVAPKRYFGKGTTIIKKHSDLSVWPYVAFRERFQPTDFSEYSDISFMEQLLPSGFEIKYSQFKSAIRCKLLVHNGEFDDGHNEAHWVHIINSIIRHFDQRFSHLTLFSQDIRQGFTIELKYY
jgi:hypothetical protein